MRLHRGSALARCGWLAGVALIVVASRATSQILATSLSDSAFWQMMTTFSEPGGYFRSENLLSNETGFQRVIPELVRTVRPGSVYLGVGPEQNFTYIAALHPALAFIVDIRHQNAMQHLLYKALFELSDDRADFLSLLFSRPRPAGLSAATPVDTLLAAFVDVTPDSVLHDRTLAAVKRRLMHDHAFPLDSAEWGLVEHNFDAFFRAGPALTYNFSVNGFGGRGRMPTYADLMVQADSAGVHRAYLASEANYAVVRDMEMRNLIVPLTGDFAGPHALRAVGDYVRDHHAVIGAFYTSNVEQYLFQQDDNWSRFYANVATLPLDSTSTFIRSGGGFRGGFGGRGGMSSSLLEPILGLLAAFQAGQITGYQDVLQMSH